MSKLNRKLGFYAEIDFDSGHDPIRSRWSRIGKATLNQDGSISLHFELYPSNVRELRVQRNKPTNAVDNSGS